MVLVEPNDLVQILIEPDPVVVKWPHEYWEALLYELLHCPCLARVSFPVQPQVSLLLGEVYPFEEAVGPLRLLQERLDRDLLVILFVLLLGEHLEHLVVPLQLRDVLS